MTRSLTLKSRVAVRLKKYCEVMRKDGRVLIEFIKVFPAINRVYVPWERLWVSEDSADVLIAGGYAIQVEPRKDRS